MSMTKRGLAYLLAVSAVGFLAYASLNLAHAADTAGVKLGGDCCADLEERIAELEATTAKKGNRKVRLEVSGQINQALIMWDDKLTGKSDARVISNGTRLAFTGAAHFSKEMDAGFIIELGVGNWNLLEDQLGVNQSNQVYTRRSAVWIKAPVGKLTLGKDSDAADGIVDGTSVVNTDPATKMLSFRPLFGADGITENADLFDGQRLEGLRYDTPTIHGFQASASWSRDGTNLSPNVKDIWAVALRYFGTVDAFKVSGGVAYRKGAVFPGLDPILPLPMVAFDQETVSGSASLLHMPTGFFVNLAAGQAKFNDFGLKITSWEVMPGVEERWFHVGKTTVFAEYSQWKIEGASDDLTYYGLGIVQAIDAAAMSLYLSARHIDPGSGDGSTYGLVGASVDF